MQNNRKAKPTPADVAAAMRLKAAWDARDRRQGITQDTMAAELDITQGAVSQYLNGKIPMNYRTLKAFTNALGIDDRDIRNDLPEQRLTQQNPNPLAAEAPIPALIVRAHRRLAAEGKYDLGDLSDAEAFSKAYVAASVEHLDVFRRMELDRAAGPAIQEELRKQSEQHPSQKPAPSLQGGKVSTRKV